MSVVELKAQRPFEGQLPLSIGAVSLEALELGALTSILAFSDGFAAAFENAQGIALPKPGRSTGRDGNRCIWFGRREVLLIGAQADAALGAKAAVVDQSDAWAAVRLAGADAVEVLARLVPVDLRAPVFKRGHTARTLVQHMTASITRTGPEAFQILVFRSMAGTLVHDLKSAMEAVAARR